LFLFALKQAHSWIICFYDLKINCGLTLLSFTPEKNEQKNFKISFLQKMACRPQVCHPWSRALDEIKMVQAQNLRYF
jgi:hypothetical protein